jgi:putative DNA methylase
MSDKIRPLTLNDHRISDKGRLIEHAFPLKQASLDSVHEKNVRHGHISTLHIWPARRPLAACRAALIATLLPDPSAEPKPEGMTEGQWIEELKRRRQALCEKIGGRVVKKIERKKMPNGQIVEREREITEDGILHWGTETENKERLAWLREEIRKAFGGRAPKVLDPFAGGGAIPLEAMRLGCEATAVDINPVAWLILKCTLEYPQMLAGKVLPIPEFTLDDEEFVDAFYAAHPHLVDRTKLTKRQKIEFSRDLFLKDKPTSERIPNADLSWHVRAWGRWVLTHARSELAGYYPTYADFEHQALTKSQKRDGVVQRAFEKQPMRFVPLETAGAPDVGALNREFTEDYLANGRNPRWVAKPTVAYLWARTVTCKNCRATIPLLKTRWLCKKENKRILLTMEPNSERTGVEFGVEANVQPRGGNAAQRREHDRTIGAGTMSRSGAKCPCCGAIMTMEDIRVEGKAGRLQAMMTAVVVEGQRGKEYRLPDEMEIAAAKNGQGKLAHLFADIPFGLPDEPLPSKEALGFRVPLYGFDKWRSLFTPRQLLALGTFVKWTRAAKDELTKSHYPPEWAEAIIAYLGIQNDKVADYNSMICMWHISRELIGHTFTRFALPITWDFTELALTNDVGGAYSAQLDWVCGYIDHALAAGTTAEEPTILNRSALEISAGEYDAVVTDPPYYDAIPYSDLMDFFYLWLKRSLRDLSPELDEAFKEPLSPKWDHDKGDGELIDDASRHGGDRAKSKTAYEEGMARAFQGFGRVLKQDGKMVVVFANKQPEAWETLVSALVRSGFVVDGSWPIQTEMNTRMRAKTSAALASSVWLVCKKRAIEAKPGWDNHVLDDMRRNIREELRDFWDAGIRGPDFVWAATGPALEAYSKHPVVKKANAPGQVMSVSEFLTHVRRMVVDFVVGRVLSGNGFVVGGEEGDAGSRDRLDEPTAYYLLHRHDFGMDEAPAGACILYAVSCGVSDKELADTWDIISFTKGQAAEEEQSEAEADADAEEDPDTEEDSGNKVKLKTWAQRKRGSLGYEAPGGRPVPLIDRVHRLMHLWKAGDVQKVDEYLDDNALRRQELFKRLLQSLIELSPHGSEERSLLESISNHIGARGNVKVEEPWILPETEEL